MTIQMDTWVLRMCRRSCIRQLFAWAMALATGLAFGALNVRYVRNFINGPFPMGTAELDRLVDPAEVTEYFVRVSGTQALDTGIRQITTTERGGVEESRRVSAEYYALQVGNRFLIVKNSSGEPTAVEGRLVSMPADLDRQLFDTPEMQAARGTVYPFYLDTDSFRLPGYCAIAAILVFTWFLYRKGLQAWRRLQNPVCHPVVARIASWGDPVAVSREIAREYQMLQWRPMENWTVTAQYLIQNSLMSFDVARFEDLVWAYKRVTKKRMNFIPAGKDHHAILICYGVTVTIQGSERQVDELLQYASQRAPWALFGYSPDLQEVFTKQPQDFCRAVEARRCAIHG
jgi:hypothetical protein